MIRQRRTKRYIGYGLVTDNIINMLKTAGKAFLNKGSTLLGDKIGRKLARKIIPDTPKSIKDTPKQQEIFKELKLRTEEDFGL